MMDLSKFRGWQSGPWYYGWTIVAVVMSFQVLTAGIYASFTFFVQPWLDEFGGTRAQVFLAIALTHFGFMITSLFLGPLMDRLPIRGIVTGGLSAILIGFMILPFAQSLSQVIAIFALTATLAMSMSGMLAGQTLAAKWFQSRRGLALGLVNVGAKLSGFVLIPLVTVLLSEFGWRGAMRGLAVLAGLLIPVVLLFIRNSPEEVGIEPDAAEPTAHAAPAVQRRLQAVDVLRNRNFWLIGIAIMVPGVAMAALVATIGPLAQDRGITLTETAMIGQALSLAGITAIVFGRLADRFDHRLLLMSAIAIDATGLLLLSGSTHFAVVIVATALVAVGNAGILPVTGAIISRCFGAVNFGRVMGLMMMFLLIGAFGAPLAGVVRDRLGAYDLFFAGLAVSMIACGAAIIGLKPPVRGISAETRALAERAS